MIKISPRKSVPDKDPSEICRTCFGSENLIPIFELVVDNNISGPDLLTFSVNIQANRDDKLPKNICEACLKELHRMYEFKRQCHENNLVLKLRFEGNTKAVTPVITENKEHVESMKVDNIKDEESEESEDNSGPEVDDKCDYNSDNGSDRDEIGKLIKDLEEFIDSSDDSDVFGETTDSDFSEYECGSCLKEFKTEAGLNAHLRNAHKGKPAFACKICYKSITIGKMMEHLKGHASEKAFQCNVCLQRFSLNSNLKRHQKIHTGETPHVCEICREGFIDIASLQAHEKTHQSSSASSFKCEQCGRAFKRLSRFNEHLKAHAAVKKISKKLPTTDQETFICDSCGRGFQTRASLQSHRRIHTGEKRYKCNLCDKSFNQSKILASHMLKHSGDRPYACSHCPKTFKQQGHLIYHRRTHTGEKPFVCTYCGKTFALKGNMTVHERTHTGETPYICPVCTKGYHDSSNLKKHLVKSHSSEQVAAEEKEENKENY